jgi:hypothetical protein
MVQYGVRFCQIGKTQLKKIKGDLLKTEDTFEVEENAVTVFLWAYGFCFAANIAITTIYWLFIGGPNSDGISFFFHIAPMVSILIDFILNLVVIELNLLVWTVLMIFIYFLVNFVYSNYILFQPVYSFIGWTTWYDSLRDVALYTAVGVVLHLIGWLLTWLKLWLLIGDKPSEDQTKAKGQDTIVILI